MPVVPVPSYLRWPGCADLLVWAYVPAALPNLRGWSALCWAFQVGMCGAGCAGSRVSLCPSCVCRSPA